MKIYIEIVVSKVLFRSMLIKKAESIVAMSSQDGGKEVRFMSLLVGFVWLTFTLLNVIVLHTDPTIPAQVTAVRLCKGKN